MQNSLVTKRTPTALIVLYCLVVILFVAGCGAGDDAFLATAKITQLNIGPGAGDAPAGWTSLHDEVVNPGTSTTPGGTSGGGTTPDPAAPPSTETDPEAPITEADADACAALLASDSTKIRVIHVGETLTLSGKDPIALKITGHQTKVILNINGTESLPGLCLFASGDRSEVAVNLGVKLGAMYYKGRGNQTLATVAIAELGELLKNFTIDLSGNQPKFIVSGAGKHICPTSVLNGNDPSVSCTPN
jgi:hypothetical protein